MPELPEVETTLRGVRPFLEGRVIERILVRERRLRWPIPAAVSRIANARVTGVRRRAKYLLIDLEEGSLLLHLGMSGSLRVVTNGEAPRKHDHFDILLPGALLRFNDPRRFGCLLWAKTPVEQHPLLAGLGPEPLSPDFSGQHLWERARGRRQAIKSFIMDGHVVVGVGNIYASESLYMAGIHPRRPAGRVALARYEALALAIRDVLERSIRRGGTTLRDYVNSAGLPGYFATELLVYERAGQACLQCGCKLRQEVIGQRASYFCPACQR